jgi:hypothetical protein
VADDPEAHLIRVWEAVDFDQYVRIVGVLEDEALALGVASRVPVPLVVQGDLVESVRLQVVAPKPVVPAAFARGIRLVRDATTGCHLVAYRVAVVSRAKGPRVSGAEVQDPHASVTLDVVDEQVALVDNDQVVDVRVQRDVIAAGAGTCVK